MSTALVLGAGGIAGVAWEIGVLAGLRRAGVDVSGADLVIGTSAGSIVGALVTTGADLEAAVESQRLSAGGNRRLDVDLPRLAEVFMQLGDDSVDMTTRCARIGALALAAPTIAEADNLAYFRNFVPGDWATDRTLLVTGVDTETGESVVWRRESGVDLVAAVTASCAVPTVFAPVTINGRRYMDGGVRSGTNADLAEGADRVVVLAPLAYASPLGAPPEELVALRAAAADVVLIVPDDATVEAFGPDVLDAGRRELALEAGLAQGANLAAELAPHASAINPS